MVFCGQCGFQIPSGVTRCPRCGTPVDTNVAVEEFYPDDATMASIPYSTYNTQNPQGPYTPGNPQKLVLRPDEYDEQGANSAATHRMDAPYYDQGMPYAGYRPQSGANYPTQTPQYADATPSIHTIPGQYPTYQPYQQAPATQRSRGRIASLIVILLGLLLILAAMALFTLFHFGYIGGATNTPSGTVTTSGTPTANSPEQQAQVVVTQYYTDVNNKDYGPAYDLWQNGSKPTKTLNDMIQGYKNTLHDDLTVTGTTLLNDGTVKVLVTLQAQEQTSSGGTQISTYKGYYIVGQQNGTWKIKSGVLNKATA
jgi:hypothetical protein